MLRKTCQLFGSSLIFIFSSLHSAQYSGLSHSKAVFSPFPSSLTKAVESLSRLPECRQVYEKVLQEGPIGLAWEPLKSHGSIGAMWDSRKRMIILNSQRSMTEGDKISTILFELHNALENRKFSHLCDLACQAKIDKASYVEAVERIEYHNVVKTAQLIEKGIKQGVFPSNARGRYVGNFDDHYKLQQIGGHSQWIAQWYDRYNTKVKPTPYKGTVPGLCKFSEKDKQDLATYITLKDMIARGSGKQYDMGIYTLRKELASTFGTTEFAFRRSAVKNTNKWALLMAIFKNDPLFYQLMGQSSPSSPGKSAVTKI